MLAAVVATATARVTLGVGAVCNPGYGSYWVQPQEESPTAFTTGGDPGVELTAYCVPTAVGNLMTYMAAVHTGGATGYNDNYDLDTKTATGIEYEFTSVGTKWLDGTSGLDKRHLGGAWHPTNAKNVGFLMGWKNEPVGHGVGVKVSDIENGLQQWLDNTQSPATAITTLRPAGTTDVDFLELVAPPYMMHIKASCIKSDAAGGGGMWKYNDGEAFSDIKLNDGLEEGALAGSTLGHTVVVYKNSGVDPADTDKWILRGASGLVASRNPATNDRDCNVANFNLVTDQTCIEGITRIEALPSDDSSKSLSTGEIIGIVVGAGVVVIVVIVVVVMLRNRAGVSVKYTRNLM